jgi:predicted ATPase
MDNDTRHQGKKDAMCELIINSAKSTSLVLVIEDAHWADKNLIEYIQMLSDNDQCFH